MPKGAHERIEAWYGRIGEWFRSTVPAAPPGNEEVAEAVLFAAKDGRFLENPFLAITTLPPFSSFPPSPGAGKVLSGGEAGTWCRPETPAHCTTACTRRSPEKGPG